MKSFLFKRIEKGDGLFNALPWVMLVALLYAAIVAFAIQDVARIFNGWRFDRGNRAMERVTRRPTVLSPRGKGYKVFIDRDGKKFSVWGDAESWIKWGGPNVSISTTTTVLISTSTRTYVYRRVRIRQVSFE